jgi:hypothetical protein
MVRAKAASYFSALDTRDRCSMLLRVYAAQSSVALPPCATARPLHTRFASMFGASVSDAILRPNPVDRPAPEPEPELEPAPELEMQEPVLRIYLMQ